MNTTACFVVAFSIRSVCVIIIKLFSSVTPVIGRFPITSHPYFFLCRIRMLTEPFLCHFTYVCHNYFLKESPVKGTAFVVAISLSTTLSPYLSVSSSILRFVVRISNFPFFSASSQSSANGIRLLP